MIKRLIKIFVICTLYLFSFSIQGQVNHAAFNYVEYKGMDTRFNQSINPEKEYFNPIISGFYPDPSICRKGDDYYMVNSSFAFYPGIPIFHSKDLVHWEQLGFVLSRPLQLNLDGIRISGGIYAPSITYNKLNDTFYVITTCVDGIGNFVVKSKYPEKDWSDPIPLPEVGGIDPSLFFDEDGKGYIVNNDAPAGKAEWEGHRAIWIHQYDKESDRTFGTAQVIIDGGSDKSSHPVWIEGPHLYKKNGSYYLMAAEGGTGEKHSEVVFRSDKVSGPYFPYKENPILTQRNMPQKRTDKVTCVGHADLIETPQGKWFAVFLGCRPYEGDFYNTGRETFLLPVTWKDNFPVILKKGEPVPTIVKKENLSPTTTPLTGNFSWKDEFNTKKIAYKWTFIRTPRGDWWKQIDRQLVIDALPRNINKVCNPAFIGIRQQHSCFEFVTEMNFVPKNESELAGVVCFQNENYHLIFGKTKIKGKGTLVVERSEGKSLRINAFIIPEVYKNASVKLKIVGNGGIYSFYAAFGKKKNWLPIAQDVDGKNLSTHLAGGFVGSIIGLYATSASDSKIEEKK